MKLPNAEQLVEEALAQALREHGQRYEVTKVKETPFGPRYEVEGTDRAAAVIFAHNHPSGELRPSEADIRIHDQLTEAGKILGLRVLDHVIVTRKGYYSFQEAGLIHS